jgi:hypothetical protein
MKFNHRAFNFVMALLIYESTSAMAWTLPRDPLEGVDFGFDPATTDFDLSGIVSLDGCSGALVRFQSSRPDEKALVLTNGHCLESGMLKPSEVVVNRPSKQTFRLLRPLGISLTLADVLATLQASEIEYATMLNTDVAFYRVTLSYAEIKRDYGVEAHVISPKRSEPGREIAIIAGHWRKIYECTIDRFVGQLREDNYVWKDSIRYSQPGCETRGGTSGAPIIDAQSRQIIGINNTGSENGERCTKNNPCEVDAHNNVTAVRGAAYGQQLYQVYSCLTADHRIDINKPSCSLPKGQ